MRVSQVAEDEEDAALEVSFSTASTGYGEARP